ncbi:MAG: NAD(P)/FAD-dependent oxidoreductase [Microthrixaceae bacterium]
MTRSLRPDDDRVTRALADATGRPFWTDRPEVDLGPGRAPLRGRESADLVVVGAGFTGLWAAHLALDESPGRRVLVVDASGPGDGASGRNGGFCDASLTHGTANGMARWPREYPTLHRLGRTNLTDLLGDLDRHAIDACWAPVGELTTAAEPWQLHELTDLAALLDRAGEDVELLDGSSTRAVVDSPTFIGGLLRHTGVGTLDPGRLVDGLRRRLVDRGGVIADHTPVTRLHRRRAGVRVEGPGVSIEAHQVLLATNAFPGLLAPLRRAVVPVYDHVLVTEPLDTARLGALGWSGRQGLADSANQFHYARLTPDDRLLWGGYDALYRFGGPTGPTVERHEPTERLLYTQLLETFPQLDGVRISHTWGGPIATTTRFCLTAGTRWDRRVAWCVGYTGLGVGASRFGAAAALDLLAGRRSERTELGLVRTAPVPWPPEPIRWAGITLTRRAIARADRREGRRGPWLRLLDSLGLGFDS